MGAPQSGLSILDVLGIVTAAVTRVGVICTAKFIGRSTVTSELPTNRTEPEMHGGSLFSMSAKA